MTGESSWGRPHLNFHEGGHGDAHAFMRFPRFAEYRISRQTDWRAFGGHREKDLFLAHDLWLKKQNIEPLSRKGREVWF